jgi:hypothetical protein
VADWLAGVTVRTTVTAGQGPWPVAERGRRPPRPVGSKRHGNPREFPGSGVMAIASAQCSATAQDEQRAVAWHAAVAEYNAPCGFIHYGGRSIRVPVPGPADNKRGCCFQKK